MIDGLRQAFSRIYTTIPKEILEATFEPYDYNESLDELIKKKVLLDRVKKDISLRGGKVFKLLLQLDWAKYTSSPSPYALGIAGSYSTFRIPPEAREHRDISCILAVRFPYTIGTSVSGTFYNSCDIKGNSIGKMACAALQSRTGANTLTAPVGSVMPGNVIRLNPPQYNFVPWQVLVRLEYDDNFSGMDVSTVEPFTKLCEFAVKQYIWTHLIFKIETNLNYRGIELGVFKDIVNSYQDAGERYEEQLLQVGAAEYYEPERLYNILSKVVPRA